MSRLAAPVTVRRAAKWAAVAALLLCALSIGRAQTPNTRARITGIHHVAFRVSDAATARGFYGGVLGLRERPSTKAGRFAYAVGARQAVLLEPGLPAAEDERLSHVAYETPDLEALTVKLRANGIEVRQPADRCEESAVRVTDPDGHTIELVQVAWPPPAAAAPEPGPLSGRLLHVGVTVRDELRAHAFYRDLLGFTEMWRGGRPEGVTQWVNMRVPDGTDYLEYMLISAPPARRQLGSQHHLCLRVDNVQEAWEEVGRRVARHGRGQDGVLPNPPQVGVNGRYQLNLFDPDGTRAELMEPFRVR